MGVFLFLPGLCINSREAFIIPWCHWVGAPGCDYCHLLPLVLLTYLNFFLVSVIGCHGSLCVLFVPTRSPLQVHQQFQLLLCPLTGTHHVHVESLAGTLGSKAQLFGSEIPKCIKGLLLPQHHPWPLVLSSVE